MVDEFLGVIRTHDRELRALAYRMLGGAAVMDDVLQEAYLKAFRSLHSFRRDASMRTWLYRIVTNACLDELRRPRFVTIPVTIAEERHQLPGVEEQPETRIALAAALAGLPAEQRAAVFLVDAQGFTYRETADILDAPEGTVATWVSRGRTRLREVLQPDGEAVN